MTVKETTPDSSRPELCTLADVRTLMQKTPHATEQDSLIEFLIPGISALVCGYTEQGFAPIEKQTTHTFELAERENALVSFAPFSLQFAEGMPEYEAALATESKLQNEGVPGADPRWAAATVAKQAAEKIIQESVRIDTDVGQGYNMGVEEFKFTPWDKRDGVYSGMEVRPFGARFQRIVWKHRKVAVTGTWGWPAIPEDVMLATVMSVIYWITKFSGQDRLPGEGMPAAPKQLPQEAYEMLKRYKRAMFL